MSADLDSLQFLNPVIAMLLGAIAGFVLVVVLSNTNREDTVRLITLAFLAGVADKPIFINGLETIGRLFKS